MIVPPEPIELALDVKQLNCSSRQELSIGMLEVPQIKFLFFFYSLVVHFLLFSTLTHFQGHHTWRKLNIVQQIIIKSMKSKKKKKKKFSKFFLQKS